MGYELDRVMRQYGVSTPTVARYSGIAAPGAPPAADASQADRDAFLASVTRYGADRREYDAYANEYRNRIASGNMYDQPQFKNKPKLSYDKMPVGLPIDTLYIDPNGQISHNPPPVTKTPTKPLEPLKPPTNALFSADMVGWTEAQKQDYYNRLRAQGYTTPELRASVQKVLGAASPNDEGWAYLENKYKVATAPKVVTPPVVNTPVVVPPVVNTPVVTPPVMPTPTPVGDGEMHTMVEPRYLNLTSGSSARDIADAYREYVGGLSGSQVGRGGGGNTVANQTTAMNYLTNLGLSNNAIQSAYQTYLNPQAAPVTPTPPVFGPITTMPVTSAPATQNLQENTPIDYTYQDWNPLAARGGSFRDLVAKYADGGPVRRQFQDGGPVRRQFQDGGINDLMPQIVQPRFAPSNLPIMTTPPPAKSQAQAQAPVDDRMAILQTMLNQYGPQENDYSSELKLARDRAQTETDAFSTMLTNSLDSPEDQKTSKAEMYFRLAAAFGAPTKTGNFSENLGMVGEQMGEFAKDRRAQAQQNLAIKMKGQELRMDAAKEDLNVLRTLSSQRMGDQRAISIELIKEYMASGKPQSNAGKQALDEGLQMGTSEFNARVQELTQIDVDGKLARAQALADNLALRQDIFNLNQEKSQRFSAAEQNMKLETETMLGQTIQSMTNLAQAYQLNPNTYDSSVLDSGQRGLAEVSGSKDPKLLNTLEMENLLQKAALSSLKATFPGAISDGERTALLATQGLGAKSVEARAEILRDAYSALQSVAARAQTRLNEIKTGAYRMVDPIPVQAPTDGGIQ
jgi:hypothetical protein